MKHNKKFSRGILISILIIILFRSNFADAQIRYKGRIDGVGTSSKAQETSTERFQCRVNVGGSRWVDTSGREWLADKRYEKGSYGYLGFSDTYSTTEPITGTKNQRLYQSERYKLFGYRIDVPNGYYEIILHFAEIYHTRKGKRLIDIKIEGKPVIRSLDIFAEIGANAAFSLTFNTKKLDIPITDGRVDIEFINKRDVVKLSAVEVIQLTEQPALVEITPQQLDFGLQENSLILTVKNLGGNGVEWSFKQDSFPHWLQIQGAGTGMIAPNKTVNVTLCVNRTAIGGGIHRDSLILIAPGFEKKIPVSAAVTGKAKLQVQTPTIDFKDNYRNLPCIISNEGGSTLNWSIKTAQLPAWVQRVYPASGTISLSEKAFINLTVSRKSLPPGEHTHSLSIETKTGFEKVLLKVSVPRQQPDHIYVKANANGLNNGRSWKNAFTRIKYAIASMGHLEAQREVEIWVAEGIYYEYEIRVPSGVQLYGGFIGDETNMEERQNTWIHQTIIDGQKKGRCFFCEHRTVVDGFVIQNGRDWSSGEGKGAAILTYDADVQIRNNLIRDNVDSWAGALFIDGFETSQNVSGSSPVVEHNVLINNFSNYCAGAIELRASSAIVRNNTIVGNKGFGLEIQDLLGPYDKIIYGDFYNNIITKNVRNRQDDVWAEARKVTNYCYVGKRWTTSVGRFKPYDYGRKNIFGDMSGTEAGFINEKKGDFRLMADSPCINSGNPNSKNDADGTSPDMGAFPFNHNQTELEISPLKLEFGSKTLKQKLTVKAYGGKAVHWHAAAYSAEGDIFRVMPDNGVLKNGEQAKLNITIKRASLSDGVYEGYIAIMTPGQSKEAQIFFFVNNSMPEIKIEPALVESEATIDGAKSEGKRVYIQNAGYGNLMWKAQKKANRDWLRLEPASGREGDALKLHFDTSKLDFGNYHENILITGSGTVNKVVVLPVTLKMKPEKFVYEIEAENCPSLPNIGWKITDNKGSSCIQAMKNSTEAPDDSTRLDYEFNIPEGVEFVYIFAEVDVNQSKASDSFWAMLNGYDLCPWDYISTSYKGWFRSWVYNKKRDKKHLFVVIPGKNAFNLFSREQGAYVNWFVITNDPNINIKTYRFGSHN